MTFDGGAGDDLFVFQGQAGQVTFTGDGGDNHALISGSATHITLAGGGGNDIWAFQGTPHADVSVQEDNSAGVNTFDFSTFTTDAVTVNLSRTDVQTVAPNLTITLSDGMGISNVIGTLKADTLIGNGRDGTLAGAATQTPETVDPTPTSAVRTQYVYLDFDTYTNNDPAIGADPNGIEHEYSQPERDAIQALLEADYHGPTATWWYPVVFSQDLGYILANSDQYVTEFFNRTPSFNRPGGESDELDFGNVNLGGSASIQVNGLTGGFDQPTTTSDNIIALSAKVAAHELAHLMGVLHEDAFGPVGYGIHTPPGSGSFNPAFVGPNGAFETFSHLISSPATDGSNRFNDLGDLYFGEREAVKLTFASYGQTKTEAAVHDSIGSAQKLTLAALPVKNTEKGKAALNSARTLPWPGWPSQAKLCADPTTHHSVNDYYSFTGLAGENFNFEVMSKELSRLGDNTIDSYLRIYDSEGKLVPYYNGTARNDDNFESSDSVLFDVILPTSGTYYVEVSPFNPLDSDELQPDL